MIRHFFRAALVFHKHEQAYFRTKRHVQEITASKSRSERSINHDLTSVEVLLHVSSACCSAETANL